MSRHVLVLDVDKSTESAWVASTTGEVWYATDLDVLLSDQETGLGYEIIALSDVTAHVLLRQLGSALGKTVSPDLVAGIAATHSLGYPDVPTELVGSPIRHATDPAWAWKGEALQEVRHMSAEYLAALVFEPETSLADRVVAWLTRAAEKPLQAGAVAVIDPVEPDVRVWRPAGRDRPPLLTPGAWKDYVPALHRELAARLSATLLFSGARQRLTPQLEPMAGAYELALEPLDSRLAGILDSSVDVQEHDDGVEVLVGVRIQPHFGDEPIPLSKLRLTLVVTTTGGVFATPLMRKTGALDLDRPSGATRTYAARLPIAAAQLKELEPLLSVAVRRLSGG